MTSPASIALYHPAAFWLGVAGITLGVLLHIPMFVHAAPMGYRMVGMTMGWSMSLAMFLIVFGLILAAYGLMPRLRHLRPGNPAAQGPPPYPAFTATDHLPLSRAHWQLVIVLVIAVAVDVLKPATLGFVLPGMAREYAISTATAGWLALVALTGTALGSVLWGRMADILGRRAAILLSALMFIATAICGAMPEFYWNLAMCFLMGLSAGGLLPITFTLLAETMPVRHRGWLLVALGGVGTAAGYLLAAGAAAWLEPLFSWRSLWLLGLPTGLLLIFLNRLLPESPRFLNQFGIAAGAQAVSTSAHHSAAPEFKTGNTAWRSLLRGRYGGISLGLVGCGVAWGLVNFGFLLRLPTNLRALGTIGDAADGLLAQSAFWALPSTVLVIWLYHRWSSIKTLVLFVALTGLSLLTFAVLAAHALLSPAAVLAATALLLVGASGVIAMLIPYAAEIYPSTARGFGTGLVAAGSKIGGILGSALGVAGLFADFVMSALVVVMPLVCAAMLLLKYGIDTRGRALEELEGLVLEHGKSEP